MNIFVLGLFLLMTLVCANSVRMPIEERSIKTFREIINEKCHLSFVDTLFKELKPLEECPDWDTLNSIDELTRQNEKDVLCLLIYDSIVSFCGDIEKLHLSDAMLELQLKHNYTLEQVCKNLLPANKHVEHDLSKIITPEKCKKLCSDYDMKEPIVECSMAFYFTHFNMSSLVPSPITPSSSNTSDSVQHSNPEATVQGQQADTPVNKSSISVVNSVANKTTYVSEEEHHDSGKTNSISPGKLITVLKKTNESVIVGQQPNPNNQETLDKTSQSEVTKPVDEQSEKIPSQQNAKPPISNETLAVTQNTIGANQDNSKQDIGNRTLTVAQSTIDAKQVIENKTLAVPQNTIETHQVAGALPNKVQGELATNKDNAEKGEAAKGEGLSLNPEMEDDEFGEQDDEDLGAETGQEQQEPPEEAQVPQAAPVSAVNHRPKETENTNTLESAANEESMEDLDGGSYFFSYFMVMCVFFVLGYVGYHNRIKVMALVLEGKRNKRQYRGRRPNSANYHKLDSNLEEAISSTCTKNANNVIY